MSAPSWKPIEPGASLCLAWQVRNKPVVLIGGGAVAAGRLLYLLESGAKVTLICPRGGMCDEVRWRVDEEGLVHQYIDRTFEGEKDIEGAYMVLTAIDEVGLSSRICAMCRERKIIVVRPLFASHAMELLAERADDRTSRTSRQSATFTLAQ